MNVNEQHLHVLTHAARILIHDDQNPDSDGKKHRQKVLSSYSLRWSEYSNEEKQQLIEAAKTYENMNLTEEQVNAAVAALEE